MAPTGEIGLVTAAWQGRIVARLATVAALAAYTLATYYVASSTSLYTQSVLLLTVVFIVLALSLDVAAGMTGLYSLGHAALFAVGAYVTAIVAERYGVNAFLLLPLSILGTAIVGAAIASLSLRLSGLYFAITTFIFSLIGVVIINRLQITGSYAGIIGPNFPAWPSWLAGLGNSLVWAGAAVLVIVIAIVRSLRGSPWFPVLLATRDAEALASSAGVRVERTKVTVFVLSSALAGAAGWLFAFLGVVSPGQFDWTVSVNILVMVILGGINTTAGPILGAVFVTLFTAYVNISPLWQQVIFGALFIFTITVLPGGMVGAVRAVFDRLLRIRRVRAPREDAVAAPTTPVPTFLEQADSKARAENEVPALECHGISYHYTKGDYVLQDVHVRVRPGTIHGLIGPNGSGKSTLLNVISGHLRPQAGSVLLHGDEVHRWPASSRAPLGLRRTFQSANLVGELDSLDNVIIGKYLHVPHIAARAPVWHFLPTAGRETRQLQAVARDELRTLGVPIRWDGVRAANAPHGVQQLLQLAVAKVGAPSILMLDEPVAGLSADEVERTAEILKELRRAGATIVIVEHHTRFIFDICDDVTVLNAGRLVMSGPAAAVRSDAIVREVYLGQ